MEERNKFRYKGKWVSEAVYKHRLQISESAKRKRNHLPQLNSIERPALENTQHSPDLPKISVVSPKYLFVSVGETIDTNETIDENREPDYMEGRRIVEFSVLAKQMWCSACKEALSFQYIENERRRGLASVLQVRCHNCLLINIVNTGEKQFLSSNRTMDRFEVNSKAVLGMMNVGMGWSDLNKILSCLDIPTISFDTFKRYKQQIRPLLEKVAKES